MRNYPTAQRSCEAEFTSLILSPRACYRFCLIGGFLCCTLFAEQLLAQQTNVNAPLTRSSHGFSEYTGVQWGVNFGNGAFFQFGGPPPASSPQGGARFGTRFNSGGNSGYFNFFAGQSSNSGLSSGSSNLTTSNGQPGGLFFGRQVPFVIGAVPVVGDFRGGPQTSIPYAPRSALQDRLQRLKADGVDLRDLGTNTGSESDLQLREPPRGEQIPAAAQVAPTAPPLASVEALSAQRVAEESAEAAKRAQEVKTYLAKADQAIASGKLGVARIYLQMAKRRAPTAQQAAILAKLRSLSSQ